MNNYLKNQIKRANCAWTKKVAGYIMAVLCPGRMERLWRKHAAELQNELNQNNWDRHGFYVSNGKLCCDWCCFTNYGYFVHEQQV